MIFIWDTVRSGRGASGSSGGGGQWEVVAWLLPDKTEAWEFQENLPIVIREKVVPEHIELLLPDRQSVWAWDSDYYILLK